jgi:chromosome segregation ATPase
MPDGTSDAVDSVALEGAAAAWLESRAEELDLDEEELLHRIIATYREAASAEDVSVVTESALEERLDAIEAELSDVESALQADVEAAESEFADKIDDVRERVIQVKRETDEKAPEDHDHPDLAERLETTAEALKSVEEAHGKLEDDVAELGDRVDAGFENFEEVLSYLRDETDSLDRKTATLASAVLAMRESLASVAATEAHRNRVEQLQREANLAGVTDADCGECGQSVTVAQLAAPECPFCGAVFEGVEPKSSWFGSHTLLTGSTPALEGGENWSDEADGDSWLSGDGETLEDIAQIAEEEDTDA